MSTGDGAKGGARRGIGARLLAITMTRWFLAGLVAIGALLRLLQYASDRSLWLDESLLALNLLQKSITGLLGPLDFSQGAPPAFLIAERALAAVFGYSEYSLRLLPLLAGMAGLVAFVPLARRVLTPAAVPMAVALVAVADGLVYYSSELKPYSVDAAATELVLLAGLMLLDRPTSRRAAVVFGVGSVIALTISFASVFAAGSGVLTLSAMAIRRRSLPRPLLLAVGAWLAGAALLVGFALTRLSAVRDAFQHGSSGVLGTTSSAIGLTWLNEFGTNLAATTGFVQTRPWTHVEAIAALVVLAGGARLLVLNRSRGWMMLLPVVLTLAAAALHIYPLTARTTLFLVPIVALLLAEGVATLSLTVPRRLAPLVAVGVGAAMLAGPVWTAAQGAVHPRRHEELKPVLAYIRDHWQAGDTLYLHYGAQYAFLYYAECGCFRLTGRNGEPLWRVRPGPGGRAQFAPAFASASQSLLVGTYADEDWRRYVEDLQRLRGRGRVWFVYSHVNSEAEAAFIRQTLLATLGNWGRRLDTIDSRGAHGVLFLLPASR